MKEMHKCTSMKLNDKVIDGGHVKSDDDPDAEFRRRIARNVQSPPLCGVFHLKVDKDSPEYKETLPIFANSVLRTYNGKLRTGKKYELDKITYASGLLAGGCFYKVAFYAKEVVVDDDMCKKRKGVRKFKVNFRQLGGRAEVSVAVGPKAKLYEPVNTRFFSFIVPEEERFDLLVRKQRKEKSKKKKSKN